ncbi:MAG: efflux RND transporter periplasmic adaptor subunit [Rhodothermaceae bacterium]|nr:efflux RND transporter periplasmic adaptor subunit [Rhodothermaceae bacterium]MXZ58539.1 efflux RND transporter periplasmic adaptor subunit [Rhodothermaceae bacterium]MYB90058.1 efflux RND transporter periplasmic adaptor subunit [Rhodothermaceae bacterium]MYD67716.1 efflux RND transporter periplasmic adaptor subunit [Rhodothermaceae bacterium]MYG43799.1 efflux RND transporter periplasmic adaptor subunit [Rhodothermaceae bacterium]
MSDRSRSSRRIKPWHIFGLVLALATTGLILYGVWPAVFGEEAEDDRELTEEPEPARAPVEVLVLERGEFPLRAEATGHLAPWRESKISAEVSGLILERPVEEGQRVQAGQVLMRLDDRELKIRLSAAEAALLRARADYAVQISNAGEVEAADTTKLAEARVRLKAAEEAFAAGSITQTELDNVRRHFEAMDVLAGNQREAVTAVYTNLTQQEQEVEQARLQLERTQVIAPFNGRVADLQVEEGQHVGMGTHLLTLLQDDRMKVSVDVLEGDLVHVTPGVTANVVVPSYSDEVFQGYVHAVNPSVDPKTGSGRITVALRNPGGRLVSGLYADVALETNRLQDRMVAPSEAVIVRQGREVVFLVRGGRSYWMYVIVGERSGNFTEIIGGDPPSVVEPGDSLVVQGNYALAHDVPVEVTRVVELGLR